MKRLCNKMIATILCLTMALCLMPGNEVRAAGTTISNIPVEGHDASNNPYQLTPHATFALESATFSSADVNGEFHIILEDVTYNWENTRNPLMDADYELGLSYNPYIFCVRPGTLATDTAFSGLLTIPVPSGYDTSSAKVIEIYDMLNEPDDTKRPVVSYTENTITVPAKMKYWETTTDVSDGNGGYVMVGGFSSHIRVEFKKKVDISTLKGNAKLSNTTYEYSGAPNTPDVTIPGLTKDTDFTVTYANNIEVGTATVTITGKGLYYGSFDLSFTITPKPVIEEAKDSSGSDYKIDSNGTTYEAIFTAPKTKNEKKVTVPDEITLPDGSTAKVTAIAKNAFKGNTKLTNATIGNNVKTIGDNAFNGCSKLTSLKLGNKVENIGKGAVSNCKSLKSVTVPASTKSIGKNAFKGDTNLKTLTINCKNLKSVDKDAIKNINPKATIKLKGSTKQKKAAEKLITNKKTGYKKSMKIKK